MAATIQSDLMVEFRQILEGEAPCEDCGEKAQLVLNCEPDYDNAPMCWKCAKPYVQVALDIAEKFWGERKEAGE